MTGRKPPGISWQSWIDRQIDQGRARGDFDDLPGHGKPIEGIERPRDELWWVRDKLRREDVEYLPPSLAIRKKAAQARQQALSARSEHEARTILEGINEEIRYLNRHSIEDPPTTLMPFDIDEELEHRRRGPASAAERAAATAPMDPPPEPAPEPRRPGLLARVRAWSRSVGGHRAMRPTSDDRLR